MTLSRGVHSDTICCRPALGRRLQYVNRARPSMRRLRFRGGRPDVFPSSLTQEPVHRVARSATWGQPWSSSAASGSDAAFMNVPPCPSRHRGRPRSSAQGARRTSPAPRLPFRHRAVDRGGLPLKSHSRPGRIASPVVRKPSADDPALARMAFVLRGERGRSRRRRGWHPVLPGSVRVREHRLRRAVGDAIDAAVGSGCDLRHSLWTRRPTFLSTGHRGRAGTPGARCRGTKPHASAGGDDEVGLRALPHSDSHLQGLCLHLGPRVLDVSNDGIRRWTGHPLSRAGVTAGSSRRSRFKEPEPTCCRTLPDRDRAAGSR